MAYFNGFTQYTTTIIYCSGFHDDWYDYWEIRKTTTLKYREDTTFFLFMNETEISRLPKNKSGSSSSNS